MPTNLQFIKSQSLTSSASIFTVTNCFSSEYDVYMININSLVQATSNTYTNMRLVDSGGNVISDSEYNRAELQMASYSSFEQTKTTSSNVMMDRLNFNQSNATGVGITIMVYNPFDSSSFTFANNQSVGFASSSGGIGFRGIAVHKSAESISGVSFHMDTGNIDSATVNVYGVK
jgi:hypothetical protein